MRSVALPCLAAALSLGAGLPLVGCFIEPDRPPPPDDNGYTCQCTCDYRDGTAPATKDLRVCAIPADNPNNGGTTPGATELQSDCQNRVQQQLQRMSDRCYMRNPVCTCTVATPLPDTFYDESCNGDCVQVPLVTDSTGACLNWDFRNGNKTANCFPSLCGSPGPVCLAQQSDPPVPTPSPLAAAIMGRTSTCRVDHAIVTVTAGDNVSHSALSGVVDFNPAPPGTCPSGQTCVGMSYRLDTTQTLSFDALFGLDTVKVQNVETLAASTPFVLDSGGAGQLAGGSTQSSGRGSQTESSPLGDDTKRIAAFGANTDPIDVVFDGSVCEIHGSLLTASGDTDVSVVGDVTGTVENTPPTASLGPNRNVECTSPTGADVVLDASSSSDRENNIVAFGWFLGTRAGDDLGSGRTITVHQPLGSQTYFVKTVDQFMQADEASAAIGVVDTTAPTITAVTATPNVLWPPNHKMVPVTVNIVASDTCGSAACQITSVASNEPLNGKGDGNTNVDWEITGPRTANIRAERAAKGNGRVYTITVGCSDPSGNGSTGTVNVTVPH